ncbi:BTAD domain-containing putative transcriptional regulator [Nitrincola alkalilacustris]|uniref:BTAD domain-containing putative transcriptional regulator n=1 Tax=Nitrincola alkalilacustris TaxID=1571224 RepID=UPI00124BFE93|nr:BTAD domain-containing putative transcriptional regulator [Nitrincola alkalilacustris]
MNLPDTNFNISLIGSACIRVGNKSFPFKTRYRKALGLFGYLAAERSRPHSREQLAALFWPELDDASARVNLRQVLASINSNFQHTDTTSPLIANRQSIAFAPASASRLDLFKLESPNLQNHELCQQSRQCIHTDQFTDISNSILMGDFLEAYSLPQCEEFEEWLSQRRAQIRIRQINLLQTLTDCARSLGNTEQAITYIQQLMRLDPDDESHLRLAMCLYIEVGRREAALKIYDTFTQRLERELGVMPQPPTLALHETIAATPAQLDISPSSGRKTFPAIQKISLMVVLRIQWVSLTQDPEETAQSLYDADQLAKSILSDKLQAFPVSGAGKGTLFYFGWPNAQDDAAWCAARGALRFLAMLKHKLPLVSARIGIHAGRLLSGTDEMIPDLIGDISEEVSHLTSCAQPGEIMVSHLVEQLLGSRIACSKFGERRRQIDGSIQSVYRLNDYQCNASAIIPGGFIGRTDELNKLSECFRKVVETGTSNSLLIRGDMGVGKTALVRHWLNHQDTQPTCIRLICTPDATHDPLRPLLILLRNLLGYENADTPLISKSGLNRKLNNLPGLRSGSSDELLNALSEYKLPNKNRLSELFSEIAGLISRLLTAGPLIIWLEDAHWCDRTTLSYLDYHLIRTDTPSLIIRTLRSNHAGDHMSVPPPAEQLRLPPLDEHTSLLLLQGLPASMRQHYSEHSIMKAATLSKGNPSFMIEMTKNAVFEDKLPDTILACFNKKIDELGELRELAALIALKGSEISLSELRSITGRTEKELEQALSILAGREILYKQGASTYVFSHPLLQQSIIELTTNSRQRLFKQTISTKLTEPSREILFLTEN